MAGCSFYAHGTAATLDAFLTTALTLRPRHLRREGELVGNSGIVATESYFAVSVCGSEDTTFEAQVAAALSFLVLHRADLERLAEQSEVYDRRFIFGLYPETGRAGRLVRRLLPPALLAAAGALAIGIELASWAPLEQATPA